MESATTVYSDTISGPLPIDIGVITTHTSHIDTIASISTSNASIENIESLTIRIESTRRNAALEEVIC